MCGLAASIQSIWLNPAVFPFINSEGTGTGGRIPIQVAQAPSEAPSFSKVRQIL